MVPAVAAAFCATLVATTQEPSPTVAAKVVSFQKEIYGQPAVRWPYAVVDAELVAQRGAAQILDRAVVMTRELGPSLQEYLGDPMARDAFRDEEKRGYPFLYLRGPDSFESAVRVAREAERVKSKIDCLVRDDPSLARVSVYRNGERFLTVAFEVAPGLQAYADIDQFRIRTSIVGRVLAGAHGERVQAGSVRVGYYENAVLRQIVVPLVIDGTYVADVEFTFYT